MIENILLIALAATFVIILTEKWGGVEWLQVHGNKLVAQMASCDFCLSFWTATVIFCMLACAFDDPWLVFGGMLTSPLTRLMV